LLIDGKDTFLVRLSGIFFPGILREILLDKDASVLHLVRLGYRSEPFNLLG